MSRRDNERLFFLFSISFTPTLLLGTVAHASRTDEDGVSDLDRLYTIIIVISKLSDVQGCLVLESGYCKAISVLSPGTF